MKYPTEKSVTKKKSDCNNPLNKISHKEKLQGKNMTAKTPAVKNSTKEKFTVKV